jgi:hypothetical protein
MFEEEAEYLSVEEVRVMLCQLSPIEATKIVQAARWFSSRCGIPADDLRPEALLRLLSGGRHVRRNARFAREVGAIIKSIAWSEIEAIRNGLRELRQYLMACPGLISLTRRLRLRPWCSRLATMVKCWLRLAISSRMMNSCSGWSGDMRQYAG